MQCTDWMDTRGSSAVSPGARCTLSAAGRSGSGWVALATAGAVRPALAAQPSPADAASQGLLLVLVVTLAVLICSVIWLAIRERRNAQRLRQARLQLQGLSNLLDVWFWRSDADHRITRIRPPAGAVPAKWSQGKPGRPLWEQFTAQNEAALRAQLDAHAPLNGIEVSVPVAHGETRTAWLRATTLTNEQGRFDGYLGIVREYDSSSPAPILGKPGAAVAAGATGSLVSAGVSPASGAGGVTTAASTSPRAAAAAARKTTAVTEALNDNSDESLAYTLSHDLRAPIRVVEGFTRILKEDYGRVLDRIGNDHLDRVLGAAARMSGMIDALLGLSQLSAKPLERQPVNLSQLAAYVAEDLRRQFPQRQVSLHVEPDLQVQGDPTLLRMVLENLLGNAWKYTGKRADAQIWFERNPTEPRGVFTVRDNGAGFDMRFADRLFGAFQRLHSATEFQGTGVGLVSVRRIVRRHGGEIWAHAEPGQGARFHFTLAPRSSAA